MWLKCSGALIMLVVNYKVTPCQPHPDFQAIEQAYPLAERIDGKACQQNQQDTPAVKGAQDAQKNNHLDRYKVYKVY